MLNIKLIERTIGMLTSNLLNPESPLSHRNHRFFLTVKNEFNKSIENYVRDIPVQKNGFQYEIVVVQNDLRCIYKIKGTMSVSLFKLEDILCLKK